MVQIQSIKDLPNISSIDDESAALNILLDICKRNLERYHVKIEEDERMLNEEVLTYNKKNCIVLRLGEKKVNSASTPAYDRYTNSISIWRRTCYRCSARTR